MFDLRKFRNVKKNQPFFCLVNKILSWQINMGKINGYHFIWWVNLSFYFRFSMPFGNYSLNLFSFSEQHIGSLAFFWCILKPFVRFLNLAPFEHVIWQVGWAANLPNVHSQLHFTHCAAQPTCQIMVCYIKSQTMRTINYCANKLSFLS